VLTHHCNSFRIGYSYWSWNGVGAQDGLLVGLSVLIKLNIYKRLHNERHFFCMLEIFFCIFTLQINLMAKTTFIVSFYWFLFTLSASAQDNKQQPKRKKPPQSRV
jgi:hypothetical protein